MTNIVICSMSRTPIAKFCGSFASMKGSELGSVAIRAAVAKVPDVTIREAFMGNVVSAGMGQAPCRQAVLGADLPETTICTTVNKVCASGTKAVILATQTLQAASAATYNVSSSAGTRITGHTSASSQPEYGILAGGFESMSQIPHYLQKSRQGQSLGHTQLTDGLIYDGLWDVCNNQHMGMCGEKCALDFGFTRQDQDEYAKESYRRALAAIAAGVFTEITPVTVPPQRKGGSPVVIDKDEEPETLNLDKMSTLRPAFTNNNGTVTAANASSLNDGAAALVLMTEQAAVAHGITPLARIKGYGEAARSPADFTTAPSLAIPVALQHAGLQLSDIDYHEINEAFAVVALANMKLLGLTHDTVNVFGGAVALGHPIGMSGARIIGTLYDVLVNKDATFGCASICNGGGGASAVIIERL